MIRETHRWRPGQVLSAYHDNAAVIRGFQAERFAPDPATGGSRFVEESVHLLLKR